MPSAFSDKFGRALGVPGDNRIKTLISISTFTLMFVPYQNLV